MAIEEITVSQREVSRYQVIRGTIDRKISNTEAANLLRSSRRKGIRIKDKVKEV